MIKNKSTMAACLFMLSALMALPGCGRNAPSPTTPTANSIIDRPGIYAVAPGLQLKISVDANDAVAYSLVSPSQNGPLLSSDAGSTFQKWFFVWDETDRLWVNSSDIGVFVWVKGNDGVYLQETITKDSPLLPSIPSEFAANLPNSIKRLFGI